MQPDLRAGPGSGWRTTELTPGVVQASDCSDRGGWKGGWSGGHCFGGLHRCLAPPPALGLKSGIPKASRCEEWPLVEGQGATLGRCSDRPWQHWGPPRLPWA